LTEDERMVQATARGHAQDRLFPRVLTAFREERFDREIMTEMGALGLLGPTLPPRPRVRWRPRYDRASEFAKGDPDLAVPSRKR